MGLKEKERIAKKDIGSIYFVAGILHPKIYSKIIKSSIKNALIKNRGDRIRVTFFDDIFYMQLEYKKEKKIILNITNCLEKDCQRAVGNNKKIIILAHSWGGILAKKAIAEFLKKVKGNLSIEDYSNLQNNIVLVTMATPHSMTYGGTNIARSKLKVPDNIPKIKIFMFGGIFDIVVPARFTFIKDDKKNMQNVMFNKIKANHSMFLLSTRVHKKVFSNIFK